MIFLKSRVISLRLPDDHWIWQEQDKQAVIRLALNLYYQIGEINSKINTLNQELNEIKDAIIEINNKINNAFISGIATEQENIEKPQLPEVDPRLARAVGRMLDI